MIRHEAVGEAPDVKSGCCVAEPLEKAFVVDVIGEDCGLVVSTGQDVVEHAWSMKSQRAGHPGRGANLEPDDLR